MKYLNKYILVLTLLTFIFSSCTEETEFEKVGENVGNTVSFVNTSASISESVTVSTADGNTTIADNVTTIEVQRSTTDLSSPLTVSLNLSGVFLSDSDIANAGDDASSNFQVSTDISNLTIPANETTASFYITTANNSIPTGDIAISISIESVSDASYQIGENISSINTSYALTIVDDDCPFNAENLTGTFEVEQYDMHGGPSIEGVYEVEITQDPNNQLVLIIDGLVSELYGTVDDAVFPLTLVTCKKEATYPSGAAFGVYNPTGGPVALLRLDAFFTGEPGGVFTVQNGITLEEPSDWVTYDDELGRIVINGWLEVTGLGSFGGKQFILNKVEE